MHKNDQICACYNNSNNIHNQKLTFLLTFRSLSETFIRWSWFSELPFLDTLRKLCVKKTVVAVAEGEAPLISVDCSLALLTDVHGFLDPSRETVRFPVNDRSIRPIWWDGSLESHGQWGRISCASVRLAVRWLLVKALLVLDSTSFLCSCSLTPNLLPVYPTFFMSCHS